MSLSDDDDDYLSADEDCLMAPPPTPALSSSFNLDEHNTWPPQPTISSSPNLKINTTQSTINNSTTKPPTIITTKLSPTPAPATSISTTTTTTATLTTTSTNGATSQYGWRIPTTTSKLKQQTSSTNKKAESQQSSIDKVDHISEQTRLTLNRLSEKLTQYDKNLFEKIAEDVKKVSIKTESESEKNSKSSGVDATTTASIPIISDFSSTLNWSWEGASKFIASASQVTSQVVPLIDSVVNVPQQLLQQQEQKSSASDMSSSDTKASLNKKSDQLPAKSIEPKKLVTQKDAAGKDDKNFKIKPNIEREEPSLNSEMISNLSNTLSWGWSGASKLLASASHELTSQVGSVLDSVVNAPQQDEPEKSLPRASSSHVDSEEIKSELEKKTQSESFFYSKKGDTDEVTKSIKNIRKHNIEKNEL